LQDNFCAIEDRERGTASASAFYHELSYTPV